MAAYAKLYWPVLKLLSLFVLFIDATTSENTTNYNFSVNVFGDQNATYIDMDNFTTTMPTGFDSTTPVPSSSTEEPVKPTLPAEPLPVSGRLLTPVFNGNRPYTAPFNNGCILNFISIASQLWSALFFEATLVSMHCYQSFLFTYSNRTAKETVFICKLHRLSIKIPTWSIFIQHLNTPGFLSKRPDGPGSF